MRFEFELIKGIDIILDDKNWVHKNLDLEIFKQHYLENIFMQRWINIVFFCDSMREIKKIILVLVLLDYEKI